MPPVCIFLFSGSFFCFCHGRPWLPVLDNPAPPPPRRPPLLPCPVDAGSWMPGPGCSSMAGALVACVSWSPSACGCRAVEGPPGPLSGSSQPWKTSSVLSPRPSSQLFDRLASLHRHLLTLPPCKDSRPAPHSPLRHGDRSRQTLTPPRALRSARRIVDMEHTRCQRHLGQRNREPQT